MNGTRTERMEINERIEWELIQTMPSNNANAIVLNGLEGARPFRCVKYVLCSIEIQLRHRVKEWRMKIGK